MITDLFDLICGTSTGGLIAIALSMGFSLETCRELYDNLGTKIFSEENKNRIPFPVMYNVNTITTLLQEKFLLKPIGNKAKVFVVGTLVSSNSPEIYLFKNYKYADGIYSKYSGTCDSLAWEAARATSAAPTYFDSFIFKDKKFVDGGLVANNPSIIAYDEAVLIWGNRPVECILSLGTGSGNNAEAISSKLRLSYSHIFTPIETYLGQSNLIPDQYKQLYTRIFETMDIAQFVIALATSTESTHKAMELLASIGSLKYFRFNPILIPPVALDSIDKQDQLHQQTAQYMQVEQNQFTFLKKTIENR